MPDSDSANSLPTYKKAMVQVVAYKRIRTVVNNLLSKFDVNTTQWMILGILSEHRVGVRITDIAKMLEVEVPLITRLSQSLLRAGLIENAVAVTDKRAKPLALTPAGRNTVAEIESELSKRMRKLEEGLTMPEVSAYFRTLRAFTNNSDPAA